MYPNPAGDEVNVDFNLPEIDSGVIEITDVYGKLIKKYEFSQQTSASMKLDVSGLQNGVYFVTLQAGKYLVSKKMIKQ